jgi:hypothetical protein
VSMFRRDTILFAEANQKPPSQLKSNPFFLANYKIASLLSDEDVQLPDEVKKAKQEEILANGLPALTFAVGYMGVGEVAGVTETA